MNRPTKTRTIIKSWGLECYLPLLLPKENDELELPNSDILKYRNYPMYSIKSKNSDKGYYMCNFYRKG